MHPAQLQPGYRLDRYELLCPLAFGGMASVWLARFGGRLGFERIIVIKMILPQFSQDPRFQEMFLDEARIVSRIEHPNVARILDVGENEGNYFIAMEWVDGDSLSKMMRAAEQRKQRIPAGVALRIIADAAAGLHATHELKDRDGTSLGVVHRDISPQNILVANNGTTMIIDFGVAKARDRIAQETTAGQLKGKIRHMAPEQALGLAVDHRADIWALGTLLYEIFTGKPPYEGVNEVASLHKLTSGDPPPPLPPTIPAVIRAVIEGALAYDAEARFTTALEMSNALEAAILAINEPTTPAMVAQYSAELLADRKGIRKRAVDAALESARARDLGLTPAPVPIATSSGTLPPVPRSSAHDVFSTVPMVTHANQANQANQGRALNMSEAPSAPSAASATLGSANMEYLPELQADDRNRRRQYLGAAILGICLAGGTIGAVLIVTTMMASRPARTSSSMRAEPSAIAPATTTAPTTTATETAPTATMAASAEAAPTSTATTAPTAMTTTSQDSPSTRPTGAAGASTHKQPAVTPPKPNTGRPPTPTTGPTPAPVSTKVDRGF